MKDDDDDKKIKESFCPICIAAVPLAFSVSTGTLVASTTDEDCDGEEKEKRKNILMACLTISLLSIFIIGYFYIIKCNTCA